VSSGLFLSSSGQVKGIGSLIIPLLPPLVTLLPFQGLGYILWNQLGILNNDEFLTQRISTMQRLLETNKKDLKSFLSRISVKGTPDSGYCFLETLLQSEKWLIGVAIFDVPS
jgi:hypothetical protein